MNGYNWMGYADRVMSAGAADIVDADGNLMRGVAMVPGFAQDADDLALYADDAPGKMVLSYDGAHCWVKDAAGDWHDWMGGATQEG